MSSYQALMRSEYKTHTQSSATRISSIGRSLEITHEAPTMDDAIRRHISSRRRASCALTFTLSHLPTVKEHSSTPRPSSALSQLRKGSAVSLTPTSASRPSSAMSKCVASTRRVQQLNNRNIRFDMALRTLQDLEDLSFQHAHPSPEVDRNSSTNKSYMGTGSVAQCTDTEQLGERLVTLTRAATAINALKEQKKRGKGDWSKLDDFQHLAVSRHIGGSSASPSRARRRRPQSPTKNRPPTRVQLARNRRQRVQNFQQKTLALQMAAKQQKEETEMSAPANLDSPARSGSPQYQQQSQQLPPDETDSKNLSLTEVTYGRVKNVFEMIDTNGGGSLSFDELKELERLIGVPVDTALFRKMDRDKNGTIDFVETLKCFFPKYTQRELTRAMGKWGLPHVKKPQKKVADWKDRYDPQSLQELNEIYILLKRKNGATNNNNNGNSHPQPNTHNLTAQPPLLPRTLSSVGSASTGLEDTIDTPTEGRFPPHELTELGTPSAANPAAITLAADDAEHSTSASAATLLPTVSTATPEHASPYKRNKGGLSVANLRNAVSSHHLTDKMLNELFQTHDIDGDGELSLEEFAGIMEDTYLKGSAVKAEVKLYFDETTDREKR